MTDKNLLLALHSIASMLDNLSYECDSSVYTLDDDEMSTIFYCRDLAQRALRSHAQAQHQNDREE